MSKASKIYPGIPSKIRIGSRDWSVKVRSEFDDNGTCGNFGYTNGNIDLIVLCDTMGQGNARVTLMHEILHAIRFTHGQVNIKVDVEDKDNEFGTWEHYFISLYEDAVPAVLAANPQLVAFLTGKAGK